MSVAPTNGLSDRLPSISAFVSHRYRSPDINLYFHALCSRIIEVQFEVDGRDSPISVARLARLIRDADAFIGIYPFPADVEARTVRADLLAASRYFGSRSNWPLGLGSPCWSSTTSGTAPC